MISVQNDKEVTLEQVAIHGEEFYKISNSDALRPFFMSIVSDSNHWMFISSNGGLTAGRKNAESALFPYYTDDKITESAEITGSKTILAVHRGGKKIVWEPFSERYSGKFQIIRNLYKNRYGNKILFEEINHDLELTFQYSWNSSNLYGFVRIAALQNNASEPVEVEVLDGIQNIVPYGVGSELQNRYSNLVDAYKRNELVKSTGLGIYALSAIIVDRAEPSEALKATVVWSIGLDSPAHLVSSRQLDNFRSGAGIQEEADVKGEKGAYFVNQKMVLEPRREEKWMLMGNVNQDHADIAKLSEAIANDQALQSKVEADIEKGTQLLISLTGASDGLQCTSDMLRDSRHFSNTLFNLMRGGIFDHNYRIEFEDFCRYLKNANVSVFKDHEENLKRLGDSLSLQQLVQLAEDSDNSDFMRLAKEYMPLKFSRRHGDPSRPWNIFSIDTQSEVDGSKILNYQGNWRDIFQNWEALAFSYPLFIENMIFKFLNASTFDGYNPYRVTKQGFDWETIEPDDPWSYIGYWGDHQIIYLLKFLEFAQKLSPGSLNNYFDQEVFVYADIPYKMRPYEAILENPKETIDFDVELDSQIRKKRVAIGADGALLTNTKQSIHKVNFIEKILATTLSKLSNLIPGGGIWMNTQRPEWNDANNALVGNGVSMVTLYYLHRFFKFFNNLIGDSKKTQFGVSEELATLFNTMYGIFENHRSLLAGTMSDTDRKTILDGLGQAASEFRQQIYTKSFSGKKKGISEHQLKQFISLSLEFLQHAIKVNKRSDKLYHAYNLMAVKRGGVSISHLDEMLEGQVAVLSAGYLSSKEVLEVLDSLKQSRLFRPDQYSYILYPNKDIPGFLEKNNIPPTLVNGSKLLMELVSKEDTRVIVKDVNGQFHFNGNFKNADDLKATLDGLKASHFKYLGKSEKEIILEIFEEVFNHKAFTGRSGTFFGYEGLGSIYWHMVSKLLLAVQECCLNAIANNENDELVGRLLEHYYEINEGLGIHKPPPLYGAFSTDPYSHTPAGKGAQQPGMTGQVKEDIISRFGELGVRIENGKLWFHPCLLRKSEFLKKGQKFHYVDINEDQHSIQLEANMLGFTFCQVPVVYEIAPSEKLKVLFHDGKEEVFGTAMLNKDLSSKVFGRTGEIVQLTYQFNGEILK